MGALEGRAAIVTGGASGIGRATAELFVAEGARVFVADTDEAATGALVSRLGHNQCDGMRTDVCDEAAVEKMVLACARRFGRFDAAVNAAGVSGLTPLVDMTLAQFEHVLRVDLGGVFLSVKHEARQLIQGGRGGAIVNIASAAAHVPTIGGAAYGSAKAGVVMLTQVAALELGSHRIRVNAIGPGLTETPMTERITSNAPLAAAFRDSIPLGAFNRPEDVARLALYLVSDAAALMTGQAIYLDGGFSLGRPPDATPVSPATPS